MTIVLIFLAVYLIPVLLIRNIVFYLYRNLAYVKYTNKRDIEDYIKKYDVFIATFVPIFNIFCLAIFLFYLVTFLIENKAKKDDAYFIVKFTTNILKRISNFFTYKD